MRHGQAVVFAFLGACQQACFQPEPAPPAIVESFEAETVYVETRPFLEREGDYYVTDALVGHLHRPHARRLYDWDEHPRGEIAFGTNDLGFRDDADTVTEGRDQLVTILVTGDSQTDGVVWNSESFPNLLEAGLARRRPADRYDVINGGVGYFGPYNYARLVEKFAHLKPALVIITFFLGNDFLDACRVLEATGRAANPRAGDYFSRFNALPSSLREVAGQSLNQDYYFSVFPAMQEKALDASERELLRLSRFCRARGIEMLVLLLPSKLQAEGDQKGAASAGDALDLSPEQRLVGGRLGAALAARLERSAVAVVDLQPVLSDGREYYWKRDHHLSTSGHRRVAEFLLDDDAARFDRLSPESE